MITVLVFLYLSFRGYVNAKCLDQEPLDLVKSFSERPTLLQVETWLKARYLSDDSSLTREIKNAIDSMVQTRAVFKIVEDGFSVLSLPKGTELTAPISLPYQNALTVMASTLNTLLDGFEADTIQEPLKNIKLSSNVVIPKDLRHNSLLEVLNRLPRYSMEQIGLVNEMNIQGRTTFLTLRNLIEKDRWQEAFASIGLENAKLSEGTDNIVTSLSNLITFTQSIITRTKGEPLPAEKLPKFMRGSSYAFGWWLNCEPKHPCLVGVLPRDTIISFSPALRMYVIPSIETGFIIANTKQISHNTRTMQDLLNFDSELFSRILRVTSTQIPDEKIPPLTDATPTASDGFDPPLTQVEDDYLDVVLGTFFRTMKTIVVLYMEFVASQHVIVRALLWVLFLLVAHLFTAWMYHGIWFVMCKLVKRTHEDRPKRD